MQVTVKKWGNSAAIRIPASVMEAAELNLDEAVDVREEGGRVVINRIQPRAFELSHLIAGITAENLHSELNFGSSVGREAL